MANDSTPQAKKSGKFWWIAVLALIGFFICLCMVMVLRYLFSTRPAALPVVPQYSYSTPAPPVSPNFSLPTGSPSPNIVYVTTTPAPVSPTPLPTATATNSSFFSWLFPWVSVAPPQSEYASPQPNVPPVQVVVITLTPTPGGFPSPPPQSAPDPNMCRNILYPARPGSQWTYYVNTVNRSKNFNMRVVAVEGSQATVDSVELETGATLRTYVQCDRDIIINFPVLNGQKLLGDDANGPLSMEHLSGVIAPNEAAFVSSNWALSWATQYRISGSGMINAQGNDLYFDVAPSNVQISCQTLSQGSSAFETVTVAAGTFNALKVICRGEGQVALTVNGVPASGSMFAQGTQWFAPNIGLVKSQRDYDYINVLGFSIPLTSGSVSGYIELKSYTIGQ